MDIWSTGRKWADFRCFWVGTPFYFVLQKQQMAKIYSIHMRKRFMDTVGQTFRPVETPKKTTTKKESRRYRHYFRYKHEQVFHGFSKWISRGTGTNKYIGNIYRIKPKRKKMSVWKSSLWVRRGPGCSNERVGLLVISTRRAGIYNMYACSPVDGFKTTTKKVHWVQQACRMQ